MMTTILVAILWLIVGVWICFKRDWYYMWDFPILACILSIVLAPINLFATIFSEYVVDKWNNKY